MLKRFFTCLPVAVIVAACSSGVVVVDDAWDPEAELKSLQEEKAFCRNLENNFTHFLSHTWGYYRATQVGNRFYLHSGGYKKCPDFFEIGETYRSGSQKNKFVKQGDDIDLYFDAGVDGFDITKQTYKTIKKMRNEDHGPRF